MWRKSINTMDFPDNYEHVLAAVSEHGLAYEFYRNQKRLQKALNKDK